METETGRGQSDMKWKGDFRELQPVDLWGGNIPLGTRQPDELKNAIKASVQERNQNSFGYFVHDQEVGPRYHLSRYPRRKYGPMPEDNALRGLMKDVGSKFGVEASEEDFAGEAPTFRVVLGLEEGYGTGKMHTIAEVAAILGKGFKLMSAEVFTAKPGEKEASTYQEGAVMIVGSIADVEKVYRLAEQFKQERFAVEDLQTRTAHIVETQSCTSPDKE